VPGYDTLTVTYRGVESLPIQIHVYDPADFGVTRVSEESGKGESRPLIRRLYPNPGRSDLFLDLYSPGHQPVGLTMYDLYGTVVGRLQATVVAGENQIRIPWPADRPAGLYLLVVRVGSSVLNTRFIRH
jgi:hypothetical protein